MDIVEVEFHEPDLDTNMRKVVLKVPAGVEPLVAKKMLRNALTDPVAIENCRVEISKIEKESK